MNNYFSTKIPKTLENTTKVGKVALLGNKPDVPFFGFSP